MKECRSGAATLQQRQILDYLRIPLAISIRIVIDSQSAQALVHNSSFDGRTKHIEVHYHFVCELNSSSITLTHPPVL